jgi:hypothetical protein
VQVAEEAPRRFDALVAATGFLWDPALPEIPGEFSGETLHVRDYRAPEPFAGRRVLVVGAGQSALDIASEISLMAAHTTLACREGHHLAPRRVLGIPFDYLDLAALSRAPWPLARGLAHALLVSWPVAPGRGGLPRPSFTFLEHRWPALVTANAERALAAGTLHPRPALERLEGPRAVFADGAREDFDAILYATGYRISFPYLPAELGRGEGFEFPLYRRVLSPRAENLAFVGVLDAGPGRPQVTEAQVQWLAAVLSGRLRLPDRETMWHTIDACGEPRTRRRFGSSGAHTVLCDRHAYLRVLRRDLAAAARM